MAEAPSLEFLNAHLGGYNRTMGVVFTVATADAIEAEMVVGEQHLQPFGIVHGGVHCGLIEAACSTGASVSAAARGQLVVGLENATSFVRAARGGTLRVSAVPITRGRRTQVWEATVRDDADHTLAIGRVRVQCLEAGEALAGQPVAFED